MAWQQRDMFGINNPVGNRSFYFCDYAHSGRHTHICKIYTGYIIYERKLLPDCEHNAEDFCFLPSDHEPSLNSILNIVQIQIMNVNNFASLCKLISFYLKRMYNVSTLVLKFKRR